MKSLLAFFLFLAISAGVNSAEILKTWSYGEGNGLPSSYAFEKDSFSLKLSDAVRTPDGNACVELSVKNLLPELPPWEIQVHYSYHAGLKAGERYVVSFYCKGTAPGTLHLAVLEEQKPWTRVPGSELKFDISQDWSLVSFEFTPEKDWPQTMSVPDLMLAKYGPDAKIFVGPVRLTCLGRQLPLAIGKEWKALFSNEELGSFAKLPEEGLRDITLEKGSVDLGALAGHVKEKDAAILFNRFESPEAGLMRIGVSADWWLQVYANGEKVYDNLPLGNNSNAFTPEDHVFEFPVKKGFNLLAFRVLSGSEGWRFVFGEASREPDGICVIRSGPEWKPLDIGRTVVKPGTALDFSRLFGAREPAGAKGRVVVGKNGRFVFEKEPGTPIRFFATNGVSTLRWQKPVRFCTWTKKDIEDCADSAMRQGYNMIRFQEVDRMLLGPKRFDAMDKSYGYKEAPLPMDEAEVKFDAGDLDRFDYLVACLKKNGIYLNFDLMSSNTGYSDAHAVSEGFRNQLFFNPAFRRSWEASVKWLFNHVNPYTGLKLKDDAALAIVEPYNEQTIIFNEETKRVFTLAFREYLKIKYQNEDALRKVWGMPDASFDAIPLINEDLLNKGDALSNDAGRFLIQTMEETTRWYYGKIREAGYPGLITQWDMLNRTFELPSCALLPVIAQHSYHDHPNFSVPSKGIVNRDKKAWWTSVGNPKFDLMIGQGSSLSSTYFRAFSVSRFLDRPFMITEYSHSAPNQYRHERGLYFSSYAALQGWDSLTSHHDMVPVERMTTFSPFVSFENASDPIARASELLTMFIWLRGDVKEAPHSVQLDLSDKLLFPRNFHSVVGDDYAKLAFITKIGIAYPDVKPLQSVGKATPDMNLTPTQFSSLKMNQWYLLSKELNGGVFPSLLDLLKAEKILPTSNKTDYVQRIFQSETSEITLFGKTETMSVTTPRLEGAVLKKAHLPKLDFLKIESCSKDAAVAVLSLDADKPLSESKRLLLVFSTNAFYEGMTFSDQTRSLLVDVGRLPILLETAKLSLKLKATNEPEIYPLHLDGTRMGRIPAKVENGCVSLSIDTTELPYGAVFFEIVFP